MREAVEQLCRRVGQIEWGQDDRAAALHVRLAREYLRRSALWAQRLARSGDWPFFDIAQAVDSGLRADADLLATAREALEANGASWWGQRICEWALHFAALPPDQGGLPQPYEPLLVLFEKHGDFTTESSVMNLDYAIGLPFGTWQEHLSQTPVVDLAGL
jgi:hypothetical protein